jgi:hypothetical protein
MLFSYGCRLSTLPLNGLGWNFRVVRAVVARGAAGDASRRRTVARTAAGPDWLHGSACSSVARAALAGNLCSLSESHVAQQPGPTAAEDTMVSAASPKHHAGSEGFRARASGDGTEPVSRGERARGEARGGIGTERIQRRQLSRHVHSLRTLCATPLCPASAQSMYHNRLVAHARRSSAWIPN